MGRIQAHHQSQPHLVQQDRQKDFDWLELCVMPLVYSLLSAAFFILLKSFLSNGHEMIIGNGIQWYRCTSAQNEYE